MWQRRNGGNGWRGVIKRIAKPKEKANVARAARQTMYQRNNGVIAYQ